MDIAVALRTLLHDSPNGRSLSVLTQCGLRDKVKFLDTTAQRGTISFFAVGDNVSNKNIQVATHSPLFVNPPVSSLYRPENSLPIIHVQAKAPAGMGPLEAWSPMTL